MEKIDWSIKNDPMKSIKNAFSIVRNIYPSTIANSLMSVQPMSPSTSIIFSLKMSWSKYYTIKFRNMKIGHVANIFKMYVPDNLTKVKLENNEVRYYAS